MKFISKPRVRDIQSKADVGQFCLEKAIGFVVVAAGTFIADAIYDCCKPALDKYVYRPIQRKCSDMLGTKQEEK